MKMILQNFASCFNMKKKHIVLFCNTEMSKSTRIDIEHASSDKFKIVSSCNLTCKTFLKELTCENKINKNIVYKYSIKFI